MGGGDFFGKIKYSPIILPGNWKKGYALDEYSITERDDKLVRTPIGEMLYQVKYENDWEKIKPLSELINRFLGKKLFTMFLSALIPVPPSNTRRPFQPVYEIAKIVSRDIGIEFANDILIKTRPTQETKGFIDKDDRIRNLEDVFRLDTLKYADRNVLLFDDVYKSGATIHCITDILYDQGKVHNVYVLTLTKVGS